MTISKDRSNVLIQASNLADGDTEVMYVNLWADQTVTIYGSAVGLGMQLVAAIGAAFIAL